MRRLDFAAVWGLRVLALLLAPLLVPLGRTWRGRALGFAALNFALLPVWCWLFGWGFDQSFNFAMGGPPPAYPRRLITAATLAGFVGCAFAGVVVSTVLLVALFTAPRFVAAPKPGVLSLFLGPTYLHRWQMALPPEEDAVWLGVALASHFDPRISPDRAGQLRAGVRALLADLAEYPEYRTLAPAHALPLWGEVARPDHGHLFAFVPDAAPGERLGLLLFLHGHGGNSVLLLHFWRAWAEANRFAVVLPSFGYGNWEHPDSPAAVRRGLDFAARTFPVDPGRVILAGLSQGGAGVGRAAAALPGRFAGLAFFSGTMEPAVLESDAFRRSAGGLPVFVAQGEADVNVTPHSVRTGVDAMRAAGCGVAERWDAGADHFLLFSHAGAVRAAFGEWVRTAAP